MKKTYNKMNLTYLMFLLLVKFVFTNIEPVISLQNIDPSIFVLKNANIQINPDELIKGHILINGKKIESVGKNIQIPKSAYEIDMTGKVIYPGFIDAWHEHAYLDSNISNTAHWNTKIHPEFSSYNAKKINKKKLNEFYKNGITSVHIVPKSGIFRGSSSFRILNSKQSELQIKHNQVIAFETNGWYSKQYPSSLLGSIALIRQTFYDALWYKRAKQVYDSYPKLNEPININNALESLVSHLDKKGLFLFETSDEISNMRAIDISNEFGLNSWIKSEGYEYRRLNFFKNLNTFFVLPISFGPVPNVTDNKNVLNYSTEKLKHWIMAPKNAGILAKNNIHFAFTLNGLKNKSDFKKNLVNMVKNHNLKKRSALKALTISPAKKLGIQDIVGKIEPGYLANLIIVNGDYFKHNTTVEEVWIGGERIKCPQNNNDLFVGLWNFKSDSIFGEIEINKKNGTMTFENNKYEIENLKKTNNQISFTSQLDSVKFGKVTKFTGYYFNKTLNGSMVYCDSLELFWEATKRGNNEALNTKNLKTYDIPTVYPEGSRGLKGLRVKPNIVIIKNATIWTSSEKGILYDNDILIRDGLFYNIDKNISIPENAIVVNARGKHITPGFIDCHSHTAASSINEGTQSVTSEVRMEDVIDSDDVAIYRELAGGLTMANILHGSANTIGGQSIVIKLKWGEIPKNLIYEKAPKGIKFALGENVKQSNWGDKYNTRYPQTRMGVEQVLRDAFNRASEYKSTWEKYNNNLKSNIEIKTVPPRRDLELDALVEVLTNDRKVHCHSYRQDEILMLTRVADDYGFTIGTFQHVLEGYKVADVILNHGAGASTFSDWWAFKYEVIDAIPYNGALMHQIGVNVSFNSDSDELARRMNLEAAKAVKYGGVSEEDAIKFITINPAIQLGVDKWVGSIEIGKEADFVIWSGHPLSTMSICEQTWINGTSYFSIDSDKKLKERDRRWRSKTIGYILENHTNQNTIYMRPDTGHEIHHDRCMEGVEK